MVTYNGISYYSCTEISNEFEKNNPDFAELKKKFCEVYEKSDDCYFYASYIQNKLYSAAKRKLIKHVEYQKKTNDRVYSAFSIPDIMDFLDLDEAKCIQMKTKNIVNMHLVEVEK